MTTAIKILFLQLYLTIFLYLIIYLSKMAPGAAQVDPSSVANAQSFFVKAAAASQQNSSSTQLADGSQKTANAAKNSQAYASGAFWGNSIYDL